MIQQQVKTLKSKFKAFINDPRWDLHPTMQKFMLKGFRPSTKENATCLCLSHSTICFRLKKMTDKDNSTHIIYCALTKYQVEDCAEGMHWERETSSPACDRLELYAQDAINQLPLEVTPFQEAINLVDKIHAHFGTMSTDSTSIGPIL